MSTLHQSEDTATVGTVQTRYPQSNLAACMLPWTERFELDVPRFEQHIQATLDDGYECLYLMGTAGEGYALSDGRFKDIVQIFANNTVRGGLDPQIGVIGISMEQVIERAGFAHDLGIQMFQISLPSWGALDEMEALLFFKTVCGTFPEARFLHYNLPRAKRIISGAEYRRIIEHVPNLVATKNSSTDYARTADLMTHVPELQHFFLESNFAMGCTMGECSLLCSYGGLFPKTTWKFFQSGMRKDFLELFRITKLFYDVGARLFSHCTRELIDGSYDKTFVWLRDPEFSNRLLPPYIGLSVEESFACRDVLDKYFKDIE